MKIGGLKIKIAYHVVATAMISILIVYFIKFKSDLWELELRHAKVGFELKVILNSQLEYFGAHGKFFGSDQMGKVIEVTKPTIDNCSVFSELGFGVDDCLHRRYSYSMQVDPESRGIVVKATEIERDGKRLVFLKCDQEIPLDQWGIDLRFKIGHITPDNQKNCILAP